MAKWPLLSSKAEAGVLWARKESESIPTESA